ncbi:MAG TPA: MerR family transcriptional regulator [Solirubrobacteraceae bacterium]|jgi:DNA-binding transcriptional MerR regulator|nr:MerR family transcriptional regulator [Solirubrobacteraceae bacterium]
MVSWIEVAGSRTDTADVPQRGSSDASSDHDEESGDGLTIEQLAAEVGMSVRNIRNHQSRGLLPAPEVRARIGYYDADHVARLRLILDLQADGFNLASIERLMSSSGGAAGRLLGLRNAMTTPYATEAPEVVTGDELQRRFGDVDAKTVERIRKLKLLIPLGDDRFEVPSPALMKAAEEVTALGISLHAALALIERVSHDCESISRAFVKLFLRELWEPFEQAGQPDERWEEMIDATDALRPIASEALLAVFKQRMTTQVERAFGRVLEQQAKRSK